MKRAGRMPRLKSAYPLENSSEIPVNLREKIGKWMGAGLGIVTFLVSKVRRARTFHPRGKIYSGDCEGLPSAQSIAFPFLQALVGPTLLRFSTALWKNESEWTDVLGIAIRFRGLRPVVKPFSHQAEIGDQDLLFATVRHPALLALAPFTTDAHDFFNNDYYAVSPFSVGTGERYYFKLSPEFKNGSVSDSENSSTKRARILEDRVTRGKAAMVLFVRTSDHLAKPQWVPVLKISPEKGLTGDDSKLRFDPFRTGKGIYPRGLVHFLRIGAYRMSQKGRE